MVKEPPYILKESGYAGFILPIDIYYKCRDDTKKVTYMYDLSLNTAGTFGNKELKTQVFKNPSDDFRRKLLKGGGVATVADRVSNADDKSRESMDDRPQLISKPKLGGGNDSSSTKKYKTKTDDPKVSFEQLFGSSNTKSSKVSPDPKNKASPSLSASSKHQQQSSGGQKSEKSSRDRPEKEKKDKNKHTSPHKEAKSMGGKDVTKKVDDKHERREEQKKDKLHSKERDRSKDKPQKQRPPSPKPRSPKRTASPAAKVVSVSSTTGQDSLKLSSKSLEASAVSERPSSSAKKSKKDKKDKSHDKDRDRSERKDKEHKSKEERPSSKISDKISTKKDGSSTPKDAIIKEKVRSTEVKPLLVPDPPAEPVTAPKIVPPNDKKVEKDPDRKHKHKKKDKNKDKDASTKDRKKEKPSKSKDEPTPAPVAASPIKRQTPIDTPAAVPPAPILQSSQITAAKPNPLSTLKEVKASSDSEDDHQLPSAAKPAAVELLANANSNIPDAPSRLIDEQSSASSQQLEKLEKSVKRGRKDTKATEKEDKKRKRKSKDEPEITKRKTPSPAVNEQEPPIKIMKKDDRTAQPLPPPPPQSRNDISSIPAAGNNHISPITTQLDHRSSPATVAYQPKSSPAPTAAHSNLRPTPSQQQQSHQQPTSTTPNPAADYMSELKNLQHKIMTLQNNQELQQVVEMIAETGCYEITSKTFDFDLCALDRSTVQKLLDFFAKSCS